MQDHSRNSWFPRDEGRSVSGDVTLDSFAATLTLPDWTPERAELARFLSARNLNSLSVRVRIRSTRTNPQRPIVTLWISLFLFFLLSNRTEQDAPTKAAVQRRYWKSREYAMDIRKTYATVTRRERWLRIQHRRGVLDTSCLLGIVTFLTECGNKEGSLGAAPPPRIAHHLGRTFTITRNGVGTSRVVDARNPPSWNFFHLSPSRC